MANRHHGEIGDIWKHLPLCEVLHLEKPARYWESHAGSACYALEHSPGRDFGVFRFMTAGRAVPVLADSRYMRLLRRFGRSIENPRSYPGSPLLGMAELRARAGEFVFCDLDPESLQTIAAAAAELEIESARVHLLPEDGIATLASNAARLTASEARETFVFLDPFDVLLPGPSGMHTADLLVDLGARGIRAVLWYCWDARRPREVVWAGMEHALARHGVSGGPSPQATWCGEIHIAGARDAQLDFDPGVLGCGLLCANLSPDSIAACEKLAAALVESYEGIENEAPAVRLEFHRVR